MVPVVPGRPCVLVSSTPGLQLPGCQRRPWAPPRHHSWAGTLLQEVNAHFASFVPLGTEQCHGMIKILSMKQHTK